MVWGALGALCSVVASCVAVIGDPPPRTWGVDAWYEVAIDAKTPALADAPFALPEGETTRALRLELPPDLPRPCTIEVRAPWFDAALVARDGAGAALGFDDDGWYGVHPALAIDDAGYSLTICSARWYPSRTFSPTSSPMRYIAWRGSSVMSPVA